jgi:hypothetical protein
MKDLVNKEREEKLIAYLEKYLRQYLTKEEWEKFLPKYVEEYFRHHHRKSGEIFNLVRPPELIIQGGFVWNQTSDPQYWSEIWSTVLYRNDKRLPF